MDIFLWFKEVDEDEECVYTFFWFFLFLIMF